MIDGIIMNDKSLTFSIPDIMKCQNRYPMLFIDYVTDCIPLKYAKGYKLFTYNEWYFHGYDTSSPKVWNVVELKQCSNVLNDFLSAKKIVVSLQ